MQPLPQRPVSPSVISIDAEKVRAQGILTGRACEWPQGSEPSLSLFRFFALACSVVGGWS